MTVDDLIDLLEGLVGHLTVRDVMSGAEPDVSGLSDHQLASLFSFIAGERPSADERRPVPPAGRRVVGQAPPPMPEDYDDDELVQPLIKGHEDNLQPVRTDPLALRGEFDGVMLP